MVLASGFTNSAVGVIFGAFFAIALVLHLLLLRFVYPELMPGVFITAKKSTLAYWLVHLGLIVVSVLLFSYHFFVRSDAGKNLGCGLHKGIGRHRKNDSD